MIEMIIDRCSFWRGVIHCSQTDRRGSGHERRFFAAIKTGDRADVTLLLDHGADINTTQADDFTPLLEAAQNGMLDVTQWLIDRGAVINPRLSSNGKTPFALVIEGQHVTMAVCSSSMVQLNDFGRRVMNENADRQLVIELWQSFHAMKSMMVQSIARSITGLSLTSRSHGAHSRWS